MSDGSYIKGTCRVCGEYGTLAIWSNGDICNRCGRKELERERNKRISPSYLEYCNTPVTEYKVTYFNPKEECDMAENFEKLFSEKMIEAGYDVAQVNEILKLYYKSLVEVSNNEKN